MTALVVIDVQNDYFPGGRFALFRSRSALRHILAWRDAARERGWPVVWIRHTNQGPRARFFLAGTPGQQLHPALQPLESEVIIDKIVPNSFSGTNLETELRSRGVETVVWTGMMSWMCLDSTVRDAYDRGFHNIVPRDATASGWMWGPYGLVTPWSAQRAFITALSFVHATVTTTRRGLKARV